MKMTFKDVAHLYMGCKLERGGTLTAGLIHAANEAGFDAWSDIKPILRKLSDMTEEEGVEFFAILHNQHDEYKQWSENSRQSAAKFGTDLARDFMEYKRMDLVVATVPYLLSRGFDLFGLIDAGLAIHQLEKST